MHRAIDCTGALVNVLFSEHRNMAAAGAFFRSAKVVTGPTPDRGTTDGRDSYPRAIRTTLGKGVRHRTSVDLNNRLEPVGSARLTMTCATSSALAPAPTSPSPPTGAGWAQAGPPPEECDGAGHPAGRMTPDWPHSSSGDTGGREP